MFCAGHNPQGIQQGISLVATSSTAVATHGAKPQLCALQVDAVHNVTESVIEVTSSTCPPAAGAPTSMPGLTPSRDSCCNLDFMSRMAETWALPRRNEPLVVVVCGRYDLQHHASPVPFRPPCSGMFHLTGTSVGLCTSHESFAGSPACAEIYYILHLSISYILVRGFILPTLYLL